MLTGAEWIWEENNRLDNDWVYFKKVFEVEKEGNYILCISADTRYFLSINRKLCVLDGGLFRDAYGENSGYVDKVVISDFIKAGQNVMEVLVWHYGNGGRNNVPLKSAGLIFACEELGIYSDSATKCLRHPGFFETALPEPSYLYGGFNIGYNANDEINDEMLKDAVTHCREDFGSLYERPVPLFTFSPVISVDYRKTDGRYVVKLPTALHVMAYMEVEAEGNETIEIRNDRYTVNGGPGDEMHQYAGHRTEYICKKGFNQYLNYDYMACEELHFYIPDSVAIIRLGYRICEYDTELMSLMHTDNEEVNILIKKCARTLKFCMRDNFMDCPDRERGQWIGDVSVQAPQIFYTLDQNAVLLLKKAIHNFISLRKGDCLVGNVPGINFSELPSQSLNAISELGMISAYYEFTGDAEILEMAFEPMVRYLRLWSMNEEGLIESRSGDWYWFDHLYNQDKTVLENTWYYMALSFAKRAGECLLRLEHHDFLTNRMASMEHKFEEHFWKGNYYGSGEIVDERANALAVLSGLAKEEHFEDIKKILITTYNCTPYMEVYVSEALFKMGYTRSAFNRIMNRYMPLIRNENATLWEDFAILGTRNHAWSGGPLTLFYRYLAGVRIDCGEKAVILCPDFTILREQEYSMQVAGGILQVAMKCEENALQIKIDNKTPYQVRLEKVNLPEGMEAGDILRQLPMKF